jgi:hypothetical protein
MRTLRIIRDETEGFLETAVWAFGDICDEGGEDIAPLDDYIDADDLDVRTKADALADCASFYSQAHHLLGAGEYDDDVEGWGSAFLLTRDGHGAGFRDGGWVHGEALTRIAKGFGPWERIREDSAVQRVEESARAGE